MSTVLVIDDNQSIRKGLRELLEFSDYSVLEAENGRVGVDIFNDHVDKIAVVVLDLRMPVMDGNAAYQEIIKIRPDTPVLITSGHCENAADLIALRDPGCTEFLRKPFDPDLLLAKVKEFANGAGTGIPCTQVVHSQISRLSNKYSN